MTTLPIAMTPTDHNMQHAANRPIQPASEDGGDTDERLLTLLARCTLRDQGALRMLFEEVSGKLNGIALRITGSRDIAEDVLQVSFIQIWNSAQSYRPDLGKPMTWMTSIVRHRALDRLRTERRRGRVIDETVEVETAELASSDKGPMDHFALDQTNNRIKTCLARLSRSQQRAILLAYYYGYTREDIAAKLGAAVGTVKSWLHRGLQRLEKCLTQ